MRNRIALTIRTQLMSGDDITSKLGLVPYSFANMSESVVRLSSGKVIKGDEKTWSFWTRIFEMKENEFQGTIIEIIEVCELHQNLIERVLQNDGVVETQIRLLGNKNVGTVFSNSTLKRLTNLGMSISIEVFPYS